MSKYPAWMQHPNCRPAFIDRANPRNSRGIFLGPLQVHSADQVEMYEAQGYELCDSPNPNQYQVEYGSVAPAVAYVHQDYPMWVTPEKLVSNEDEHLAWMEAQEKPKRRKAA